MKKFEYKEPEFKVIRTLNEDILTASENPISAALDSLSDSWDSGSVGGSGGVGFGV